MGTEVPERVSVSVKLAFREGGAGEALLAEGGACAEDGRAPTLRGSDGKERRPESRLTDGVPDGTPQGCAFATPQASISWWSFWLT